MTTRAPRNMISRTRELSLRAAELLDDGLSADEVAAGLNAEFNCKVSARTVNSFRTRDYEPIRQERLQRIEDAQQVQLILDAARGSGASFAEATSDLLAKQFYDLVRSGDTDHEVLIQVAKSVSKLRDIELQEMKVQMIRDKEEAARMKTIFWQRERVNQSPTRSGWSGRRGGVGGHKRDNCRLLALFFCVIALLPGCATRRYVREQIAINNCMQVLKAIDRENGILYAASEMDAERSGPQRSEIGQKAYDKTVYEMFLRLKTRNETTQKINEVGQ